MFINGFTKQDFEMGGRKFEWTFKLMTEIL